MPNLTYRKTPDGIIFRIEGSAGYSELHMTRAEVEATVINMCRTAGLPEPWGRR